MFIHIVNALLSLPDTNVYALTRLKVPSRSRDRSWDFIDRYGYRYGDAIARHLLPLEKKLAARGCFFQEGTPDKILATDNADMITKDMRVDWSINRQGQRQSIVIAFAALELIRTSYGCP
nr:DNA-directed RNA polymerase V subunit 1 [Tanacetum cinerariifolium]